MTPESDSAAARLEPAPIPGPLPPGEQRAIDAAVAGAAGLLLGRVLFGRAGGLVAGLAAVGAGLLAKRHPAPRTSESPAKSAEPVPDRLAGAAAGSVSAALPVPPAPPEAGMDRDAPGRVSSDSAVELPVFPVDEDADAFAEMPALFLTGAIADAVPDISMPDRAGAPSGPIPDADELIVESAEMPVVARDEPAADADVTAGMDPLAFDTAPPHTSVEVLPVAELVARADRELAAEVLPDGNISRPGALPRESPAAESPVLGLIAELPPGFAALQEEPDPGPREDFLIIPDQAGAPSADISMALLDAVIAATDAGSSMMTAESPSGDIPVAATPVIDSAEKVMEPPWARPIVPPVGKPVITGVFQALDGTPVASEPAGSVPRLSPLQIPEIPVVSSPPAESPPLVTGEPTILQPPPAEALESSPKPPPVPVTDPEAIWRLAAVEMALKRGAQAADSPAAAAEIPIPPVFPASGLSTKTEPLPASANPSAVPGADPPSWMKNVIGGKPAGDGDPLPDSSGQKAFMPTIRLAVPEGSRESSGLRPLPVPPTEAVGLPSDVAPSPFTVPVAVEGRRAGPLPPVPPAMELPADLVQVSALRPLPVTPVAMNAPTAAISHGPAASPPVAVATNPAGSGDAEQFVFVPLKRSSHRSSPAPRRRSPVITSGRVGVLVVIAAAALGYAYRPQLIEIWQQRILGRLPRKNLPVAPAQSNGSDVRIANEPPSASDDVSRPAGEPAKAPVPAPAAGPPPATPAVPN